MWERTYYILLFNSSPADETKSEMYCSESFLFKVQKEKYLLICETFWATELQIDRQTTTKTDRQTEGEKQHGQKRQVVTVGMTSDRFKAKQHDRPVSRRQTEQTGTCKHPCTPVELHVPRHTLLWVCV